MKIKKVFSFDGYEYNVIVSDGQQELMCACFPCHCEPQIGMEIEEIHAEPIDDAMRIDEEEYLIKEVIVEGERHAYYMRGRVINTSKPMIAISGFTIELETHLAKDIKQGEFVEFKVGRLDCFI